MVPTGGGRAATQAAELAFFPLWSYAHPAAIELAERLAVSRTTIYYWVRDLPIERDHERMTAAALVASRVNRTVWRGRRERVPRLYGVHVR